MITLSSTLLHSPPSSPSSSPSSPSSPQLPFIERIPPLVFNYRNPSAPSSSKSSTPSPAPIVTEPQQSFPNTPHYTVAADRSPQRPASVETSTSPATTPTMVTASPIRTGITRSTRPPMLPLAKSSLSTFIHEPQLIPALPSPKHPSPRTPPARTPHRHSHDGSTRERHPPFLTRRSSASTFGGRDAREDGPIDSPAPPSATASASRDRQVPSAASSPHTPAETPRRMGPGTGPGAAHVDHLVPARSSSLALPLKPPPSVGTPLLMGVAERPENEGVELISAKRVRAETQSQGVGRGASMRSGDSIDLKLALGKIMDFDPFAVPLPEAADAGVQSASSTDTKAAAAAVEIPGARDERAGEGGESHRHARSLDLHLVTERNVMAHARAAGSRAGWAQAT